MKHFHLALKNVRPTPRSFLAHLFPGRLIPQVLGWLFLSAFTVNPLLAAERIYISYGILERSIPISALETFARTGKIEKELASYTDYISPEQLDQFRNVLQSRIDLSPVAISQFLYTPIGETLLDRLGQVIQSESRQPGFYSIRAALILAAADPEGLTLLNILRKYPTRGIRIDVSRSLEIVGLFEQLVTQTTRAFAAIDRQSSTEAVLAPDVDFSELPDLRNRGSFNWNEQTLTLTDLSRSRTYPVDLYLPVGQGTGLQVPYPMVVISHGLGSDRSTFAYLARHLASYGIAVAVPEHPGSNAEQLKAVLSGTTGEVSEPIEFVNRPLDVKYLLDELTRRSQVNPTLRQIDLQRVGLVGQSFGGYTVLALAGADINFARLGQDCPPNRDSLDLSLVLQCLALSLPQPDYDLADPRVRAVIALNPVTSSVFGQNSLSQIKVPVMFWTASADSAAPALPEQIRPFTWLTTPNKYLVALTGGTHFSTLNVPEPGSEPVPIPEALIGPNPAVAQRYLNALSVAFFQAYVSDRPNYRVYLTAAYASRISQPPLELDLVQSFTAAQLAQALEGGIPEPTTPPPSQTVPTLP